MSRARITAIAVALATLVAAGNAAADEVVLINGDRITGKLVGLAGSKLSIKTEYAGILKIDWDQVQTFSTDAPVYVTIGDNTIRATVLESASGTATLESEDLATTDSIELSRLKSMSYERKPPVRVSGRINVGASSTSGNTNVDKLNASAEVVARSDLNRFTAGGQINKAEDDGTQTESNWLAYLKYDHFISEKWYAFANGSGENDKFKDIKLRTTFGVGGGYQFFETDRTFLSVELGANYVNTDFTLAEDQDYPAARWALDFSQKVFKSEAQLFHRHQLFSSLDESDNLFIRTQTGLRLPIVERLNSTIQYNYDWDDNPAPGRVKEDKAWLFTLGYTW